MNDRAAKSLSQQARFEPERGAYAKGTSLPDLRDTLRLKKVLGRAVMRDFAPTHLIGAIRRDIRT